jgi:serine/threonine protein kinase
VILKLCEILNYLHKQNPPVIHRDIKPQNIILTDDGKLRLIDLGISRRYHESGKKDTVFMGTEATAAPEQFGYMQTDTRSDIYSLGILMFYLITGSFDIQKIDLYKIEAPLKNIIKRCIKFSPDDRFASINQIKSRLEQYLKPYHVWIKISISLCLLLLATSAFLLLSRGPNLSENIKFTSPLIEKAVLKELGKAEGESVTYNDLQNVTKLLICGETLYSAWNEHRMYGEDHHLNGISMQEINGPIENLDDLAKMKNLSELALYGQKITDLTPLEGLNITRLGLGSNSLKDISSLKEFKNLVSVNIADNPVSDLTPIKDLKSLSDLDISCTAVNDIYPIAGLFIADLSILDTPVQDYSPLMRLPRLEVLRARSIGSEGIDTIIQLSYLKNLTIYNSGIEDIGIFSSLPRLEYLDLYFNDIKSIENIGSLKRLRHAGLGGNEIIDLSPITQLKELTSITINNTLVENFAPLAELPNLDFISCTEAQAEEIKKVLGNTEIQFWIQK